MKASYLLSFLCGAAVMLGFRTLAGSQADLHATLTNLRLYHVNEGKMEALKELALAITPTRSSSGST